jgi:hypothetical protein
VFLLLLPCLHSLQSGGLFLESTSFWLLLTTPYILSSSSSVVVVRLQSPVDCSLVDCRHGLGSYSFTVVFPPTQAEKADSRLLDCKFIRRMQIPAWFLSCTDHPLFNQRTRLIPHDGLGRGIARTDSVRERQAPSPLSDILLGPSDIRTSHRGES